MPLVHAKASGTDITEYMACEHWDPLLRQNLPECTPYRVRDTEFGRPSRGLITSRARDARVNRYNVKLEPCWLQGPDGVRTERIKRFRCIWALQHILLRKGRTVTVVVRPEAPQSGLCHLYILCMKSEPHR